MEKCKTINKQYMCANKSLLVLSFVLLVGCHDDMDESFIWDSDSMTSITMVAPDFLSSVSTKSSLTPSSSGTAFSWKNGDIVAVYSESKGMTNFYIDDETISEDGTSAEFNGSGFKLLDNKTYYAFYPYSSSIQSLDKNSIPVNYAGQEMGANGDFASLGDFDYMCAKGTTDNNGLVSLSFQHLGCVVEYKLTVPKTANYTQFRLEFDDLISEGIVNIADEEPCISTTSETASDTIMTVKLNGSGNGIEVVKDSLLTVYMMMPPQNLSGHKITIRLTDKDENWYSATVDGKDMRAGYTYHYEVNSKNGGFTGSGTGLPNGDLTVELLSVYTDASPLGYEGMILDNNILYTSGAFGVRALDYSNEASPSLIGSQALLNMTNNRTDMLARSIAMKDDYLYVPIRQSSSGVNENTTPEIRFRFESTVGNYADYSDVNGISSNATVNAFFKVLHTSRINLNQNFKVLYLYKGAYQYGYWFNTINLQAEDGTSVVLFRETFDTEEEAHNALKTEYRNAYGDYCVVDWSALPNGMNIFQNVRFYTLGEFDAYQHSGTASISASDIACPNYGLYSICMASGNSSSDNEALLTYNLSYSKESSGELSFWLRIDKTGSSDVEIPLLGLSGESKMSMLVRSEGSNVFSIGLKSEDYYAVGATNLSVGEWYHYKVKLSDSDATIYWRTKELGNWNKASSMSISSISFNQLTAGIKTEDSNVKMYFDDYYYNPSDIDDVSYVNGKLAILKKSTLEVCNIYNLDVKAIDAVVYGDCLLVTCFYGFNVYDISDVANPKLTYTYRVNSFQESQNCDIYEDAGNVYAFICNYYQGYTIADITDINNVSIVCKNDYKAMSYNGENIYGKIYNFDVYIDYPYAYLTSSTMRTYLNTDSDRRGILTIDLSDFNNPNPYFCFVPSDAVTALSSGDPRPTRMARSGDYLIINNTEKGLLVFDIGEDGYPVYNSAITVPGKPCVNNIYVPYDGTVFVNDNSHEGSTWPDRNVYLFKGF